MKSLVFNEIPFFILPELEGNIDRVSDEDVFKILEPFKKEISYTLRDHIRVKEIKSFLINNRVKR